MADEEAVLLQADSSAYFGLNQSGTRLWAELAERPMTLEQLASWTREAFPDAPAGLTAEISAFLDELGKLNLLLREQGPGLVSPSGVAAGESPSPSPWESPAVERFGELEKLILSGE